MLEIKVNGVAPRGAMRSLCEQYGITRQGMSRIWKLGQQTKASLGSTNVSSRKRGNCGRRPKHTDSELEAMIKAVPKFARSTYRSLSAATSIPLPTLWKLLDRKLLCRRTSRLKPILTPSHKTQKIDFVRGFVRQHGQRCYKWQGMMDRLWHDEDIPQRKCMSKRHIQKVMFLTTVARPRFDFARYTMWDGKLGTWALGETELSKPSSKNRARGTLVTTPQDNARPHVNNDDPVIVSPGRANGWDIRLVSQPPMSPDFYVLELGFFNAIQALQHQKVTRCVDDLLPAVKDAFVDLDWKVLDKTFITLQKVLEEAFKFGGDNVYRLPHLKKDQAFKKARQVLRPNCEEDVCSALDAMDRRFDSNLNGQNYTMVLNIIGRGILSIFETINVPLYLDVTGYSNANAVASTASFQFDMGLLGLLSYLAL
ncbi:hypothetical protein H257_15174 [Aphanomyces astaci]|uniref:Transposase Tc1-like domain-containing protein n=1 Tax=Aphanomyces astaci TaxID=112090 RepID=W4FPZ1_APHAT|nr:hypothetical protein H257_15174 [Aphanomyces astaci]ETV69021.1 hypothetical protein H257_15174 [Aphanomyces astaci]|eukprot:XP_009841480.1 hypothetical protein H257_15174 [Aphanomyces astaci]